MSSGWVVPFSSADGTGGEDGIVVVVCVTLTWSNPMIDSRGIPDNKRQVIRINTQFLKGKSKTRITPKTAYKVRISTNEKQIPIKPITNSRTILHKNLPRKSMPFLEALSIWMKKLNPNKNEKMFINLPAIKRLENHRMMESDFEKSLLACIESLE